MKYKRIPVPAAHGYAPQKGSHSGISYDDILTAPPGNPETAVKKQEITKSHLIAMLMAGVLLVVLYISNILAIKGLLQEQFMLLKEKTRLEEKNDLVRAEIQRLKSVVYLPRLAERRLGLVHNPHQPTTLVVYGIGEK